MSKSAKDSTRFTATGVWAHTKPGRALPLDVGPAPKNETPQQKVKRLREAANRAKMAQVTKWDVAYFYGRAATDFIHRATVYGIIFATGCIGVLAVFSIGDMVVYNRRKRAIYFQDQERQQAQILQVARDAVATGSASPAQMALVEGIREEEEAMQKKNAERKVGSRILWWLHGGWNEDKELEQQRKLALEDARREAAAQNPNMGVTQAVQEARANASAPTVGGPLDQLAANAAGDAEKPMYSKGWFGWMMKGNKKDE